MVTVFCFEERRLGQKETFSARMVLANRSNVHHGLRTITALLSVVDKRRYGTGRYMRIQTCALSSAMMALDMIDG